jgi:hypothetical protein
MEAPSGVVLVASFRRFEDSRNVEVSYKTWFKWFGEDGLTVIF